MLKSVHRALQLGAALCFFLFVSTSVFAQESGRTWEVYGLDEVFTTQRDAEQAIQSLGGVYEYIRFIEEQSISEEQVKFTYWMGTAPSELQPWLYISIDFGTVNSEPAVIDALMKAYNKKSISYGCTPKTSVERSGSWAVLNTWEDGISRREMAAYRIRWVGDSFSGVHCANLESFDYPNRERTRCSNPHMDWEETGKVCLNSRDKAIVVSTPLVCDACSLVGNPGDVTTGDKYEPEPDFDFGWIAFTRYYHSGTATAGGGFGYGWTHSHNLRLTIGIDTGSGPPLGLVQLNGAQIAFRRVGSAYEATVGSGDRIVADGAQWRLYQSNSTVTFDAEGKLLEQRFTDGTALVYAYDAMRRLDTITHSSGRRLQFLYAAAIGDAPISDILLNGISQASYAYTTLGQVGSVTYPDGSKRTYHYEDARFPQNLTGITAEDERRYSTFAYDAKGRLISSQHAGGANAVSLAYTPQGGAIVTDVLSREANYGLTGSASSNAPRKVANVTDSAGTISRTYYDAATDFRRRLDTVTDRNGTKTKHAYAEVADPAGDQFSVHTTTEAVGTSEQRTRETRRALSTNRLVLDKIEGQETRYTLNTRLQSVTITVADTATGQTRTTQLGYCEAGDVSATDSVCPILGLLKFVDGPRVDVADRTIYTYYPSDDATCASAPTTCPHRKGDLWMVQDALGNITETLKYDGAGRVLSVKDANGVITDFEYHPRGWLSARKVRGTDNASEADDQITRIDYYPTGLVQKTTLPDGSFTSYTYDAAHRLTDIADGEGNKLHYTLDNAGNRTKEETLGTTGTVLRTLSRVYNQLGQLQTHKDAYEHATGYVYDANGNTDTVTDALNRVTDNDYDPLNRLTKTIQDVGGLNVTTQFKYDAQDNLTEVIDPKNLSTKYSYNGLGDLMALESPDTGTTSYTYDSAGNRATQADARGVTATYGYDALNRLISVSYPDSSLNVGYSYDTVAAACAAGETFVAGRLSLITDGSGSTQYCYDRFGQMVRKVQTTNGRVLTVRYAYTKSGQVSRITYPDGTAIDYVRNALGRTTEVDVTFVHRVQRQVLLTSVGYYPFGPASEWVFGNGRLFQRTLNQNYQPGVVQDQSAGGLSLGYEFDAVGNLVKLRNGNQSEPPLRRYAYDALNRLTEVRDGATDTLLQGYGYDATGNRVGATDGGVTTAYTLAANSHRLMDAGRVARTYDNAGNTTSIGGTAREFVYSDANRMSAVKQDGVTAMSYAYNGKGEQVRRNNGAASTLAVYDEAGHWLGEYDSAGAPKQQVVWLDDLPVGLIVGLMGEAALPLHYIEADALGTPRVVVNAQRNTPVWAWPLTGDAFGNTQPIGDVDRDGTSLIFNLRFPGQRYDAASGLNQNGHRDYEPGGGRYVESDPIGLDGGPSTYAYVGGNPVNAIDPFGLIAYLCQNGNNINITIPVAFARDDGVTPQDISRITNSISSAWSRQIGGYNVTTSVQAIVGLSGVPGYNNVHVNLGYSDSATTRQLYTQQGHSFAYAHEAGHWMGLPDRHGNSRFLGNIMNGDSANGVPWPVDISAILGELGNNREIIRSKDCGCE